MIVRNASRGTNSISNPKSTVITMYMFQRRTDTIDKLLGNLKNVEMI